MKLKKMAAMAAVALLSIGVLSHPVTASAKGLESARQAEQKALAKVKNAVVTDTEIDHEGGKLVYEVELLKGTREYRLKYRASDGRLIAYEWEEQAVSPESDKSLIGADRCRALAQQKVKNAVITSVVRKYDDGVSIYKVKMETNNKKFKLEFHARTGQLLKYEWKLVPAKTGGQNSYIGLDRAKSIALKEVPGATVLKAKLDEDDGRMVYEVELLKDGLEYEFTIDAKTGKILEMDIDD